VLVGTVSIEKSEKLSTLLTKRGVRHEVLNAKNHAREAMIIAEAGEKGAVTIATNMAGRGTDIKLGGNPEHHARKRAGADVAPEKFAAVLQEETEKWRQRYEEVKALGGLYVIGTERHESRRIDNQLRGRSGRQGDPGRSKFFISMDDDLMRLFGGEKMKNLMKRIGMEAGEPIYHPMLNKSIERAQKRVEERNFETRKHLLEYDDVLNQQRKFIYEQRDAILKDDDLQKRVNDATEDMVSSAVAEYQSGIKSDADTALKDLAAYLKTKFNYTLPPEVNRSFPTEQIQQIIVEDLKKDIDEKAALIGPHVINSFIRMQYLQFIDRMWLDHLENMEALREAVYLRHYAQKNPLTEYKLEGFNIFDTMVDTIRAEIASRTHLVRITQADNRTVQPRSIAMSASHGSVGAFGMVAETGTPTAERSRSSGNQPQGSAVTVVRAHPKVGRNDPCPCGSGKKYKHCHGR
jgi:preprotein translocase subunit SecA